MAALVANAQVTGNWTQQSLLNFGYDVNHWVQFVDAVDSNVCWGLSADRNGQTNPLQEFLRTTDGGTTWSFGTVTGATGLGPSSICAIGADTAWVTLFNPAGGGGIYRTTDGGTSWTHQSTATFAPPSGFPNIAHFFDGNNGVAMGDPNGGYFEIYTTVDGGNNWVRTPQANIPVNLAGEFGITDVYTALAPSTLWFGTNKGRIYKTIDGGVNWTVASTPYLGFIGGIAFKDANYGLACEADVNTINTDMIVTTDGGATWNILNCVTGNVGQKQTVTFVPGTDSTFVFTSPYNRPITNPPTRDFGSGFSTNNGNDWYMVSQNLEVFSDNDFAAENGGWAGGLTQLDPFFGLFRDPVMFKWTGPLYIPLLEVEATSIDMDPAIKIGQVIPLATVQNNSLYKGSFNVTLSTTGYTSTKPATITNVQGQSQITFDPWTPASTGNYVFTLQTQLASDQIPQNDTITNDINVLNEFANYGWLSFGPINASRFGIAGSYNYVGVYPNGTGTLFAIGGADLTSGQLSVNNDKFDAGVNSWSTGLAMPTAKYQFSCQTVNNKIYAVGGYLGGFTPDSANYIYDPSTDSWTPGQYMPVAVGDYASGVYNDSLIYYIGGLYQTSGGLLRDTNLVQIYDTYNDTWTTATSMPGTKSSGLRGSIYNDKIVVAGGFVQLLGGNIRQARIGTIDAANPSLITWTAINDYPAKNVNRHAAGVPFGGKIPMIMFTGGDPSGTATQGNQYTFGYDVVLNEWLIGPPKPTGVNNISDFVGTIYNDSLYMASVSGYNGTTTVTVNEWLNLGSATILGVQQFNAENNSLLVYPNPSANGLFKISVPTLEKYTLTVYNCLGSILSTQNFSNQKIINLNLNHQNRGMYFVKLESPDKNYYSKIIIN